MTLNELRKLEKGIAPLATVPADYPRLFKDNTSINWLFAVLDHMPKKDREMFLDYSHKCAVLLCGSRRPPPSARLAHLYETVRKQLEAGTLYGYLDRKLLRADYKPKLARVRVEVRMTAVRRACAGLPAALVAAVRQLAAHDARKGVASLEEWATAMQESAARIEKLGYRLAP